MTEKLGKEKPLQREVAFLAVGIIMALLGGFVTDYLTMFSKERMLEDPLNGSIMAFIVILVFFAFLIYMLRAVDIKINGWFVGISLLLLTLVSFSLYYDAKTQSQKIMDTSGVSIQTTVIKPAN